MYTVTVFSDLHNEFVPFEPPGGDILILAGDIVTAKHLKTRGELYDRYLTFFNQCADRYNHVLFVPGNHESYGYNLSDTKKTLQENVNTKIRVCDRDRVDIGDWTFLLTTLWTDCNKGDPLTYNQLAYSMNDFKVIRHGANYARFTPQDAHKLFNRNVQWLKDQLAETKDRKVFVVTHHGPSHLSIHPRYQNDQLLNGGYVSDLSDLMLDNDHLLYWAHGHVHSSFDYTIGTTRVITNPKGYYNENPGFRADLKISL